MPLHMSLPRPQMTAAGHHGTPTRRLKSQAATAARPASSCCTSAALLETGGRGGLAHLCSAGPHRPSLPPVQGAPLMSSRPAQYQPKPAQQPEQLTALDLAMQPDQAWASHQPHRDQGAPLQESRPQGTAQPASHPDAARFNGRHVPASSAAHQGCSASRAHACLPLWLASTGGCRAGR